MRNFTGLKFVLSTSGSDPNTPTLNANKDDAMCVSQIRNANATSVTATESQNVGTDRADYVRIFSYTRYMVRPCTFVLCEIQPPWEIDFF